MAKKIYPGAAFEPCANEALPFVFDLFAQIALIAPLPAKTRENMEKCPGAMRLRRFRRGELICRQGEEDCTAFYILKSEDIERLHSYPAQRLEKARAEQAQLDAKIRELEATTPPPTAKEQEKLLKQLKDLRDKRADLERELEQLPALDEQVQALDTLSLIGTADAADPRKAAIVYLGEPPLPPEAGGGWLQRLKQRLAGVTQPRGERAPVSIPFDGPTDISLRTRQAILYEGEIFGEMACLNRIPRTATVAAARDCYILEMLSNILSEIDKDKKYQEERNRVYTERALNLHLRGLSIFRDLSDEQFTRAAAEIRGKIELVTFKTGEIICDEHERSDCVYLVRSGLVQVKKNVSSLLSIADVSDWRMLIAQLRGNGPLLSLLPAGFRAVLDTGPDAETLPAEQRSEIVHGLNDLIKSRHLSTLPEFKDIIGRTAIHGRVQGTASFQTRRVFDRKELEEVIKSANFRTSTEQTTAKVEEWSELDRRRFNRLLLQEVLPQCLRWLPLHRGPDAVLTYCTRGEFLGEMGVCRRQPRSSTCIAFGQPRSSGLEELVQVELVRIPGAIFLRLIETYPAIRARVEAEIPIREKRDETYLQQQRPGQAATQSPKEAERLGLIEGQQLMLIDMERCTLCGECVRGCVDAHADGRSRLFLVGQRYEKYLVPITCRSCLDPVCMIDCPVRSIQRGDNREMIIKDWCIGCQKCAKNCPYDAIKMHELPGTPAEGEAFRIRNELAVVCDLCSALPDQNPRCVYACPHEAALRVNARLELPIST